MKINEIKTPEFLQRLAVVYGDEAAAQQDDQPVKKGRHSGKAREEEAEATEAEA